MASLMSQSVKAVVEQPLQSVLSMTSATGAPVNGMNVKQKQSCFLNVHLLIHLSTTNMETVPQGQISLDAT